MESRPLLIALALLATSLCVGCGGDMESSLTGTVTFQGKPLPHALVSFQHKGRGATAYTMTDDSGYYYARTGGQNGLTPGTYQASIQPPKDVQLPKKYFSIVTSEIELEIKQGKNIVDIDLVQ